MGAEMRTKMRPADATAALPLSLHHRLPGSCVSSTHPFDSLLSVSLPLPLLPSSLVLELSMMMMADMAGRRIAVWTKRRGRQSEDPDP